MATLPVFTLLDGCVQMTASALLSRPDSVDLSDFHCQNLSEGEEPFTPDPQNLHRVLVWDPSFQSSDSLFSPRALYVDDFVHRFKWENWFRLIVLFCTISYVQKSESTTSKTNI